MSFSNVMTLETGRFFADSESNDNKDAGGFSTLKANTAGASTMATTTATDAFMLHE